MAILVTVIQTSTRGIRLLAGSSASLSLASSCENRKEGRASSRMFREEHAGPAVQRPTLPQAPGLGNTITFAQPRGFCKSCHPGDCSASQGNLLVLPQGNTDLECRAFRPRALSQRGLLDSNVSFLQHSIFSLVVKLLHSENSFCKVIEGR